MDGRLAKAQKGDKRLAEAMATINESRDKSAGTEGLRQLQADLREDCDVARVGRAII